MAAGNADKGQEPWRPGKVRAVQTPAVGQLLLGFTPLSTQGSGSGLVRFFQEKQRLWVVCEGSLT